MNMLRCAYTRTHVPGSRPVRDGDVVRGVCSPATSNQHRPSNGNSNSNSIADDNIDSGQHRPVVPLSSASLVSPRHILLTYFPQRRWKYLGQPNAPAHSGDAATSHRRCCFFCQLETHPTNPRLHFCTQSEASEEFRARRPRSRSIRSKGHALLCAMSSRVFDP